MKAPATAALGALTGMMACALWAPGSAAAQATDASDPAATIEQDRAAQRKHYAMSFRPVVIDNASADGTTLGLDYDLWAKVQFARNDPGAGASVFTEPDINAVLRSGQVDVRARGTLVSTKEKNPNKLVDFTSALVYVLDAPMAYIRLGALLAFETDQSFENRQAMYGASASVSKVRIVRPGDAGSVIVNYGSVDPLRDAARQKALGSLDSFERWNLELSYSIAVNQSRLRSLDFNYRHYQETSPPTAIRAAGLDSNRLGLIRANLDQGFFLQYSRGSLPFDQKSERAVKLGWSLKFE